MRTCLIWMNTDEVYCQFVRYAVCATENAIDNTLIILHISNTGTTSLPDVNILFSMTTALLSSGDSGSKILSKHVIHTLSSALFMDSMIAIITTGSFHSFL